MFNVGRLNKRVQLQSVTVGKNSVGEATYTYTTYATVWAAIEPMTGNESVRSDAVVAITLNKITIRYNSSLKETDHVLYGDRIFEINAIVTPQERAEYMELTCSEVK